MKVKEKDTIKKALKIKWLTSYLLFFFIPLVFYIIFGITSSLKIYKSVSYANAAALQSIRYQLDSIFNQVDSFAEAVLIDNKFTNFSSSSSVTDLSSMYLFNTTQEIRHMMTNYGRIEDVVLYSPELELYISSERWGNFKEFYLRDELSLGYSEEETKQLLSSYLDRMVIKDVSQNYSKGKRVQKLLIMRPLSYAKSVYDNTLNIAIIIDVSKILPSNVSYNNLLIINKLRKEVVFDFSGNFCSSNIERLVDLKDGKNTLYEDYIAVAGDSSLLSLKYISLMDRHVFFTDVYSIIIIALIYFVISIIIGMFLMNKKVKKEWSTFESAIEKSGAEVNREEKIDNAYSPFVTSVSLLKKETESMGLIIQDQTQSLKDNMLSKLVERTTGPISVEALNECGITFLSDSFLVLLVVVKPEIEEDSITTKIVKLLRSEDIKLLKFNSNYGIAFIINPIINDASLFYASLAQKMKSLLLSDDNEIELCSASDLCQSFNNLGSAYLDAINVMEYQRNIQSREFLFYRDVVGMTSQTNFSYTTENEINLQQLILEGNSIESEKLVDKLILENKKVGISPRCLRYLLFSIAGTIIRTVNMLKDRYDWSLPEIYFKPIVQSENFNESVSEINQMLITLCDSVKLIKDENSNATDASYSVYQKALKEIQLSYMEQMLNVSELAERLEVSMVYLSKIFKKYHNENISDYIASYRVMMAKKRLAEGARINEVVTECGFGSTRTFLRVFKNLEHITPGQYKTIKKEDSNE